MRILHVHMHGQTRAAEYLFRDADLATIAYERIKSALNDYREFGNEKHNAVTVKGDDGGEVTFKLAHLSAIGIVDPDSTTDLQIQSAKRLGQIERSFREEAGLDKNSAG